MKRIITYSIIALLQASVSLAQTSSKPKLQKREKYEWQGEIPTYVETLKKELTYPMAWGNSPIRNFKKWKKAARAKVFECMMTPPKAAAAWDMEVLGAPARRGCFSVRRSLWPAHPPAAFWPASQAPAFGYFPARRKLPCGTAP